jgi:site-specific recombinase XerD
VKLFLTDKNFIFWGVACPGIPFLCDKEMELVAAPNSYLRFVATVKGRTRSPNTWATYGNHIYEFFSFLQANNISWETVEQTQIAAWRNAMLERGCSRSTVNQRLLCIHAFYEWAVQCGKRHSLPFSTQDIWVAKSPRFLKHIDTSGGRFHANELTIQTQNPLPKFLHMDMAIRFLDSMTPHSLKLMGYLALLSGMRREEIVGLDYRVVPNPAGHDPDKQVPMTLDAALTPTKGSKTRTVMLPYDLAVSMWDYFLCDWPKKNATHTRKHKKESNRFFLSHYGEELSIKYLNNAFAKTSAKTGIKCHPHMLRHTYGTYELLRMGQRQGQSQALLWVRDRMGHSSITNTEKYIHSADLLQHDDVDGYPRKSNRSGLSIPIIIIMCSHYKLTD